MDGLRIAHRSDGLQDCAVPEKISQKSVRTRLNAVRTVCNQSPFLSRFRVSFKPINRGLQACKLYEFCNELHSALRGCLGRIEDLLALKPLPVCAQVFV
jgi:hypothetical protein